MAAEGAGKYAEKPAGKYLVPWLGGGLLVVGILFFLSGMAHARPHRPAGGNSGVTEVIPSWSGGEAPRTTPLMLLYNPMRTSEMSIFQGGAQRFIQTARPLRARFNALPSRDKVQFLERYVFALCNSRLVNGMDMVFKMETAGEGFCGYSPGMLSCFAADNCDEPAYETSVAYIRGALAKFDKFIRWSERRKWQYRGDARKVAFYTRVTQTRSGFLCTTLKLLNENEQAAIVHVQAMQRNAEGQVQAVLTRPYYLAPKSSLPNLSDEDLFSKDTEARMRKLMSEALAAARQAGISDIQAYTGTHERWNCFPSSKNSVSQPDIRQVYVEFLP